MHPYIAFLILQNPADHAARRPDECCFGLRDFAVRLWQRWQPRPRLGR